MDNLMLLKEHQTLQDLNCIVSDLVCREAHEASCLQVLKQVGVEELEHKAVVLSELELIEHSDQLVLVCWILLHDVRQILSFLVSKLVVHLCISGDL